MRSCRASASGPGPQDRVVGGPPRSSPAWPEERFTCPGMCSDGGWERGLDWGQRSGLHPSGGPSTRHPHSPPTQRGAGAAHPSGMGKPGRLTLCVASDVASPQGEGLAGQWRRRPCPCPRPAAALTHRSKVLGPEGAPGPVALRRAGHRPGDARRLGAGAGHLARLTPPCRSAPGLSPAARQGRAHGRPGLRPQPPRGHSRRGGGAWASCPPALPGEAAWGLEGRRGGTASLLTPVSSLLLRPPLRARPFSHSLR